MSSKDEIATIFGGCLGILGLLFLLPILCAFFGGVGAWIVGLAFGDVILRFLAIFGITGFSMFQIGVCLGFVGGYFKTYNMSNNNK